VADGADPAAELTEAQRAAARQALVERATLPLAASPELRAFLLEREILIDETSVDELVTAGFDGDATARARQMVDSFQAFIQAHRDEITALQVLFGRPYSQRRLDYAQVQELAGALQQHLQQHLHQADPLFLTEALWRAYQQLERDRVRGASQQRILADLVSLVRHAALDEDLTPFAEQVKTRYQDWLAAQAAAGRQFGAQERWWLDEIARHIGINVSVSLDDLNHYSFQQRGGQVAAQRLFGAQLPSLLDELNTKLGV